MKFPLSLFILVICVSCAIGQISNDQVCTNRTIENISSRGINIGANVEQIKSNFERVEPGSSLQSDLGYERLLGYPIKLKDERFKGIVNYDFYFLDGQLVSYGVRYDTPKWLDLNQYLNKLVEMLDLPSIRNWSIDGSRATLRCGDYELTVSINQDSYFGIDDRRLNEILAARKKKLEDQERESAIRAFKP